MSSNAKLTVVLPHDIVREIDRLDRDHTKFVVEAVRHELLRRRDHDLARSLDNPHPESILLAERGFADWAAGLPHEDCTSLVDIDAGTPVRWVPGQGWMQSDD